MRGPVSENIFSCRERFIRKAINRGFPFISNWRARKSRQTWFTRGVSDRDTKTYLLSPQSQFLHDEMVGKYADEVAIVKHRLQTTVNQLPTRTNRRLRIALSNHGLRNRGGSELWTADIADFLVRHGAEIIVYAPVLQDVAKSITATTGAPVTSSVTDVQAFSPDILHVQHFSAVKPLVDALRSSPTKVVNMCHGLLPRLELPQPDAQNYCTVSLAIKTMVCLMTGAPWQSVPVLPNFFDERRYLGEHREKRQRRALLFSRRATPRQIATLRDLFARAGLALDFAGMKGEVEHPEDILPRYEVVLAVGRSAVEALASGCRVILWDQGVIGPAVTASNFWQCVALNFALPSRLLPYQFIHQASAGQWLELQLEVGALDGPDEVYRATRKYLTLENAGLQLHQMYNDIVAKAA